MPRQAIPDGKDSRPGLFSARFDGSDVEKKFREVYRILKEHGYPVLMVNARAGADFGDDTMAYLGQLKKKKGVLLSVCTWHYAEVTGSKYSSFEELKFAHGNDLDILPLRVCDDPWPPEPPNDEDGKSAGLLAMAIPRSRVFVDCRKLSEQEIAFRIAEELRQGATPVGHGKKDGAATFAPEPRASKDAGTPTSATAAGREDAKAWFSLAQKGGGEREGRSYTTKECLVKSLEIDSANAQAWFALGKDHGGASIKGATYSKSDCYAKSLEYDDTGMHAWRNLGLHGGGTVKGRLYSQKECFVKALGCSSTFADAWHNLGQIDGGNVQGKEYSKQDCYIKALDCDDTLKCAWRSLAKQGGGIVRGRSYSAADCEEKGKESADTAPAAVGNLADNAKRLHAKAWFSLAQKGGGEREGRSYTTKECLVKSLEIDSANAQAWFALAFSHGGASIKGATYSKSDCYAKSLEYDDTGMHVWRNLGLHGGGTVKGRLYSQKECFQKALGCNSTFAEGWNSLGYVGGGNVHGKDYSRTECYVKALESDSSLKLAWHNLAKQGGGVVRGRSYSAAECEEKSKE